VSIGEFNEIYVYADSLDWELSKDVLSDVFEEEIRTPQYEKLFYLNHVTSLNFKNAKERRNLLLVTSLESGGPASSLIRSMISPSLSEGIRSGEYYIFHRKDEWARKQMLVLLISKAPETLNTKIRENKEYILDLVNRDVNERIEESTYKRRLDKKMSKNLFVKYGFGFNVHKDYSLVKEDSTDNFIWFRRWGPDRMLFIHWLNAENGDIINEDWFIETRDKITLAHVDSSVINPYKIQSKTVNFAGWDALQIRGFWEITNKVLGGPFVSYAFFDPRTKRIYIVDTSVFHPGKAKEPFLRQLRIIAETFSVEATDFF